MGLNKRSNMAMMRNMEIKIAMGKELGRSVSIPEVFLKINYDEKTRKWIPPEVQKTYDAYGKLKTLKVSQGITNTDDSTCFYEANGGCNKKRLAYGFGSEMPFYSSRCSGSCVIDVQKLNDCMSALEQQNMQLESELSSLRNLIEKLHNTNHNVSSSTVPPNNHDDDCRAEEEFGDDYAILEFFILCISICRKF
ncbi:neuronal acetylcholine receptor subunit alpha-5 [Striga asiatica]|uniref:Neuronal acetylcholine receptor subunit alpha-5 n=1 Tax=Striga asiatica TaxID=4170 RepID=A0A5A7Q3W7_STRAF|nr:neuronal acetylcholine receptor subunit alpha-5 [Striga asiatica]